MKKTLSILLSFIMIISTTAGIDFSVLANTSGDYEYTVLDDGTAEITGYKGNDGYITIPSTFDGYTVTSIGNAAFQNCDSLTSVIIPNSVTRIGQKAFRFCDSLTDIIIPDSVEYIEAWSFESCKNLTNVFFSGYLKSIGYASFSHCDKLISISFQNGIERIGYEAFYFCANLSTVILPKALTEIGGSAFEYTNIKNVFYFGGIEDWNKINIVIGNDVLLNANIHFNTTNCDVKGHSFGNNLPTCIVCGIANPNYVSPQSSTQTTPIQPSAPTLTIAKEQAPAGAKKVNGEWVAKKQKNAKIKKLTKAKKSFKATWKKVNGVKGYQIQYSTSKKFTKKTAKTVTIKKNKTTSKTVKKLKAKKKYYVRIRTYKNVKLNGKTVKVYSSWSKAKTVKTK